MHANSLTAFKSITSDGSRDTRSEAILAVYASGKALTDRMVLNILFPGSDNLNLCRPRISEAIAKGLLEECGNCQDEVTGKNVRLVRLKDREPQLRMF